MYAFQLWREFKLSLAEIFSVFPSLSIVYADQYICIVDTQDKELLLNWVAHMWGIIKLIELLPAYKGNPAHSIIAFAEKHEWKFRYGISQLWEKANIKGLLLDIKRFLQKKWVSARFVNKDFKNLSTAQIKWEKLIERETDFSVISAGDTEYFGKTIWIQDIDAYSKRDYGKTRDMQVGMLPPKLAQMMMNFSSWEKIYDPFCWLGTILIESIIAGNSQVYGSDISPENVEKTKKNISFARKNFENSLKTSETAILDARGISSSPFLKKSDVIVTEGYLWQIFQKFSITEQKVSLEKEKLLDIYEKFFEWLKRANYSWVIVISFPFWDIRGKYHYFNEVYDVIGKYCKNLPLLPKHESIKHTRSGSLLYKRPDQIVGREIFKLKLKNNML